MSWRIVVVSSRAKLDYKLNFLVIRKVDSVVKIHLSEIAVLVVESTAVSLTAYLLSELAKHKIKVVFCDEQRNPQSEMVPYYGCCDATEKLRQQLSWSWETRGKVWARIVVEKISKQADVLEALTLEQSEMLRTYADEVENYDQTNREGFAAKVYFNALFGPGFSRNCGNSINAALNYGYSLLLSTFSREAVINGYLTRLGIFHDNKYNFFNLACDLMEPFRPVVDWLVKQNVGEGDEFTSEVKQQLLTLFGHTFYINGMKQVFLNCVRIYSKSVFNALNSGNANLVMSFDYEK